MPSFLPAVSKTLEKAAGKTSGCQPDFGTELSATRIIFGFETFEEMAGQLRALRGIVSLLASNIKRLSSSVADPGSGFFRSNYNNKGVEGKKLCLTFFVAINFTKL
jgi:hypothetical protein